MYRLTLGRTLVASTRLLLLGLIGVMACGGDGGMVSGTWSLSADMPSPRYEHGGAVLTDGRVLVAGGMTDTPMEQMLGSSATYDPQVGSWTPAGDLNLARQGGDLTALLDGDAVIVGGAIPGETYHHGVNGVERFDASTGTWSEAAKMSTARKGMATVRLSDGRIMVIGGADGPPDGSRFLATAEIYDPIQNTWTPTHGKLNIARDHHLAVVLHDGRVLIVGGEGPWKVDTLVSELYDVATDSFVEAGRTNMARYEASATLMPDGRVLVAGGWNPQGGSPPPPVHASTEIFDPARGTWELAAPMTTGRRNHAAFVLPSGQVMVAGGTSDQGVLTSTEVFDPETNSWSAGPDLPTGALSRSWVPINLPGGAVMLTGGYGQGGMLDSLTVLDDAQVFTTDF